MRLVVDLNRCQGYAQCVFLAPDVFDLRGNEALHYDPNPDDAESLRVLRAAAACPVQAILVEQLDEAEAGGAACPSTRLASTRPWKQRSKSSRAAAGSSSSGPRWPGSAPPRPWARRAS